VAQLIAEVYAGKLHLRIAAGLAPLLNLQLLVIETTNVEPMAQNHRGAESSRGVASGLAVARLGQERTRFVLRRISNDKS
jgi:hypothetical protein